MTYSHDGRTLEIITERVEVSSYSPEPDPRWTFTDAAGHAHAPSRSGVNGPLIYPTMELATGAIVWCEDCQDDHGTECWWECRICGEKILPGIRTPVGRRFVPGLTSYEIDGMPCTPEQAREFVTRCQEGLNDQNWSYRRD